MSEALLQGNAVYEAHVVSAMMAANGNNLASTATRDYVAYIDTLAFKKAYPPTST